MGRHKHLFVAGIFLLLAASAATCRANEGDAADAPAVRLPAGVRVSLTPEKADYVIGEPAMVNIEVTGEGATILEGGDYRGSDRPLRYMMRAWDEKGIQASDPSPMDINMGGRMGSRPLPYRISLNVQQWCRIDKAGTYRVGVGAAWGWTDVNPEWGNGPWGYGGRTYLGQFTITFRDPTAEEAARVFQENLSLQAITSAPTLFARTAAFRSLCHPIYLPHLETLAESPDAELRKLAVAGVDSILTPEATRVLMQFLDDGDSHIVDHAGRRLSQRMSRRELAGASQQEAFDAYVRKRVQRAWHPESAEHALNWARKSLDGRGAKAAWAALFIQYLGNAKDLPLLSAAIEQAAQRWSTWRSEDGRDRQPERTSDAAERAARVLFQHGAHPPARPQGPGESVLWAVALGDPAFRPDGWEETAEQLMNSRVTVVRYKMMENMPLPIPKRIIPLVGLGLHDDDGGVRCAAAGLAYRSKDRVFGKDVLERLRQEEKGWPLRSAITAAEAVARDEMAGVAADRLTDRDNEVVNQMYWLLVRWAVRDVTGSGQNGPIFPEKESARSCQQRWREWIAEHGAAVRESGGFPLGDARLRPGLFPPSTHFNDKAGHSWPSNGPYAEPHEP